MVQKQEFLVWFGGSYLVVDAEKVREKLAELRGQGIPCYVRVRKLVLPA